MQNRWFLGSRNNADDSDSPANSASKPTADSVKDSARERSTAPSNGASSGFAASTGDLLNFEEIYHSAGIKSPKLGYSIIKVIEMLQSEHIRNLGLEMRRASLLMALEAAGVQVDEVLQDATLRQRAINSYEAIQRKHLEEYEARKAQENCTIQAEMERVAAEYSARISNNLDEVAREKDGFRKWQARKQQEAQKIAEAVALCVTHGSTKPGADPLSPLRELASSMSDPAYSSRG
jgi:hypothetical protein